MAQIHKTNFQKVIEFNKVFGIFVSEKEIPNIFIDKPDLVKLRYSLIDEEINELIDAFKTQDFIEIIDALSDILYVVYGAGCSFGIDIDSLFKIKYNQNKNSNYQTVLAIKKTNTPILKNIFYNSNYLSNKKELKVLIETLNQLNMELKKNINNCNFELVKTNLVEIIYLTYSIGIYIGINLDHSFDIVHKSNMSKTCLSDIEAQNTVQWYKENSTNYDSPNYRKSECNKYYIIYNQSTGKILKSINYTPANFEDMLL